jgi:uncharacterized Fe-S cluster-containing radical SAM superfamily protein
MEPTARASAHLRDKGIDLVGRRILITQLANSQQSSDITLSHNCQGFGRIHHFRRQTVGDFPANPLPIDPGHYALGLPFVDQVQVQVFQNAVCSWRCWYCFVDYSLLSGNPKRSQFLSADEMLDLYLAATPICPIIDLSGGQPDLVPEWGLWITDALRARGLDKSVYVWSDDNLSNDYLWEYLSPEQVKRLAASPNYGRVGCFKGYDADSFAFNTGASSTLFADQFRIMRRLVDTGFDVYGYVTLTAAKADRVSEKVAAFIDRLQEEVHPLFPLRTVPLAIQAFTPTKARMQSEHYQALEIQQEAITAWNEEIQKRYAPAQRAKRIYEHNIQC